MKKKETLIELIEKCAVEPYKKFVLKEIQPSIRLKTTGEQCQEIGKTKLGGCPDLSKNISWARSNYDNQYLSFLGQVNLREVKMLDELDLLPKNGLLYFFFNLDSGDDGKVIFSKEESGLERANLPEELKEKKKSFWRQLLTGKSKKLLLKESQVRIYNEYNVPSWDSLILEKIQKETNTNIKPIDAFKEGTYENVYEEEETETTSNHHLLGHYKGIQNEFHELNFLDTGSSNFEHLTLDEINEALKWKLLFQFDSDNNLEISWGDWGRVYFFIHEDDLKNRNFDNVKISADCY
jgi:uncharacterized protein YwqG